MHLVTGQVLDDVKTRARKNGDEGEIRARWEETDGTSARNDMRGESLAREFELV